MFQLPIDEAIFLYEVYTENTNLAKKIQKIMRYKTLLPDYEISEPLYFNLSPEETKRMQTYIHSAKARIRFGMMKLDVNFKHSFIEEREFSPTKSHDDLICSTRRHLTEERERDIAEFTPVVEIKLIQSDQHMLSPTHNTCTGTPSFNAHGANALISFNSAFFQIKKSETDQPKTDTIEEFNYEEDRSTKASSLVLSLTPSLNSVPQSGSTLEKIPNPQEIFDNEAETMKELPDSMMNIDEAPRNTELDGTPAFSKNRSFDRAFTLGKMSFNQAQERALEEKENAPMENPNGSFMC